MTQTISIDAAVQHSKEAKPAFLTRQELAYLSGQLTHLTGSQKSKLNYKIKKKLEVFENVELPLLVRAGIRTRDGLLFSLLWEKNKDCHSSDPGSNPGPGALVYNYPSDIEASGVRISAEN